MNIKGRDYDFLCIKINILIQIKNTPDINRLDLFESRFSQGILYLDLLVEFIIAFDKITYGPDRQTFLNYP